MTAEVILISLVKRYIDDIVLERNDSVSLGEQVIYDITIAYMLRALYNNKAFRLTSPPIA
jgi:hypothetical protein